jgi:hypothetical protein
MKGIICYDLRSFNRIKHDHRDPARRRLDLVPREGGIALPLPAVYDITLGGLRDPGPDAAFAAKTANESPTHW